MGDRLFGTIARAISGEKTIDPATLFQLQREILTRLRETPSMNEQCGIVMQIIGARVPQIARRMVDVLNEFVVAVAECDSDDERPLTSIKRGTKGKEPAARGRSPTRATAPKRQRKGTASASASNDRAGKKPRASAARSKPRPKPAPAPTPKRRGRPPKKQPTAAPKRRIRGRPLRRIAVATSDSEDYTPEKDEAASRGGSSSSDSDGDSDSSLPASPAPLSHIKKEMRYRMSDLRRIVERRQTTLVLYTEENKDEPRVCLARCVAMRCNGERITSKDPSLSNGPGAGAGGNGRGDETESESGSEVDDDAFIDTSAKPKVYSAKAYDRFVAKERATNNGLDDAEIEIEWFFSAADHIEGAAPHEVLCPTTPVRQTVAVDALLCDAFVFTGALPHGREYRSQLWLEDYPDVGTERRFACIGVIDPDTEKAKLFPENTRKGGIFTGILGVETTDGGAGADGPREPGVPDDDARSVSLETADNDDEVMLRTKRATGIITLAELPWLIEIVTVREIITEMRDLSAFDRINTIIPALYCGRNEGHASFWSTIQDEWARLDHTDLDAEPFERWHGQSFRLIDGKLRTPESSPGISGHTCVMCMRAMKCMFWRAQKDSDEKLFMGSDCMARSKLLLRLMNHICHLVIFRRAHNTINHNVLAKLIRLEDECLEQINQSRLDYEPGGAGRRHASPT